MSVHNWNQPTLQDPKLLIDFHPKINITFQTPHFPNFPPLYTLYSIHTPKKPFVAAQKTTQTSPTLALKNAPYTDLSASRWQKVSPNCAWVVQYTWANKKRFQFAPGFGFGCFLLVSFFPPISQNCHRNHKSFKKASTWGLPWTENGSTSRRQISYSLDLPPHPLTGANEGLGWHSILKM